MKYLYIYLFFFIFSLNDLKAQVLKRHHTFRINSRLNKCKSMNAYKKHPKKRIKSKEDKSIPSSVVIPPYEHTGNYEKHHVVSAHTRIMNKTSTTTTSSTTSNTNLINNKEEKKESDIPLFKNNDSKITNTSNKSDTPVLSNQTTNDNEREKVRGKGKNGIVVEEVFTQNISTESNPTLETKEIVTSEGLRLIKNKDGKLEPKPTDKIIELSKKEPYKRFPPITFIQNQDEFNVANMESFMEASELAQGGKMVLIEGHTDDKGSEEYNIKLSMKRVEKIRKLMMDLGVPDGNISVIGYGESRPLVPNDSEPNREKNRRIEFLVF